MSMQELFDAVNAQGNVNNPAVLQAQTMNLYTGGSLFMRMPKRTYPLASVTPPSWNAGCGGIDLFMGGFSFINKEQFVAMLRNIGSNALGYAFKLAIQNLCPTCDNVMQALQATAQQINRLNMDTCAAAQGIVNAALPETWTRGRQNAAKNFGVDANIFENITDAWTNVMNHEDRANDTVNQVAETQPEARDQLPTGNVVWKALKKLDGLTDEYRMVLMSMIGSTIFQPMRRRSRFRCRARKSLLNIWSVRAAPRTRLRFRSGAAIPRMHKGATIPRRRRSRLKVLERWCGKKWKRSRTRLLSARLTAI